MPEPATQEKPERNRQERFLSNVLWSWTGVAANLFVGFILSPYIIRKLGAERYGIWALIFSILDYFWFFDLGLNTAICNFAARYLAVKDNEKINELINTALFYFSMLALGIWALAPVAARNAHRFFHVSPAHVHEFSTLILITSVSWGFCMMLHMFVSVLDGFQRFDLTSRIFVGMLVLRSAGYALTLKFGYGLVQMAMVFVGTQILGYALNYVNFTRAFPARRLSFSYVRAGMFRQIMKYGLHSFVANSSTLVLYQGGPVMIGHYLPAAFVGFYTLPARLFQYAVDAVSRVGLVTRSSAAELTAIGRRAETVALGVYSNRYSLTLFMPLVIFILVYGRELITRWVGAEFAAHSVPLLPVLVMSNALVLAAQFNSSAILFGLGRHGGYARGVVVEALCYMAGLMYAVPRFGILGAVWVAAILMMAVRGLYTPWLVCRALDWPFLAYMRGIYARPILAGVPVLGLTWLAKRWIPGNTWLDLFAAGGLCGAAYAAVAFFTCVDASHRALLLSYIPVLGPRLASSRA